MFWRRFWPAVLWSIVIMFLMGLPGDVFPEIVSFWDWLSPDKIVHLFVFGTLSFLILLGLRDEYDGAKRSKYVVIAVSLTVFYGVLTELLQYYVFVGRSGNIYDAIADALGALLGWLLFKPGLNALKKMKLLRY